MCAGTRPPTTWRGARRGWRPGTTMRRHGRARGLGFGGGAWWWWCSRVVPLAEVGARGVEWGGGVAVGQQPEQGGGEAAEQSAGFNGRHGLEPLDGAPAC